MKDYIHSAMIMFGRSNCSGWLIKQVGSISSDIAKKPNEKMDEIKEFGNDLTDFDARLKEEHLRTCNVTFSPWKSSF